MTSAGVVGGKWDGERASVMCFYAPYIAFHSFSLCSFLPMGQEGKGIAVNVMILLEAPPPPSTPPHPPPASIYPPTTTIIIIIIFFYSAYSFCEGQSRYIVYSAKHPHPPHHRLLFPFFPFFLCFLILERNEPVKCL